MSETWGDLHDSLLEELTSQDFMSKHPELPAGSASLGTHPGRDSPLRGFYGDSSIKSFAQHVGSTYQDTMKEIGVPDELIAQLRPEVEEQASGKARKHALDTMKHTTASTYFKKAPITGHVVDYLEKSWQKDAEENIAKGQGSERDYIHVGQKLGEMDDEAQRGWWARRGHNLLGIGQYIGDVATTGRLGGTLAAGGAEAIGAGKLFQGLAWGAGATAAMPQRVASKVAERGQRQIVNEKGQLTLNDKGQLVLGDPESPAATVWKTVASEYINNTIMPGMAGIFTKSGAGTYTQRVFKKTLAAMAGIEAAGDITGAALWEAPHGPGAQIGMAVASGDPEKMKHALAEAAGTLVEMGLLESVVQAGRTNKRKGLAPPKEDKAAEEILAKLVEAQKPQEVAPEAAPAYSEGPTGRPGILPTWSELAEQLKPVEAPARPPEANAKQPFDPFVWAQVTTLEREAQQLDELIDANRGQRRNWGEGKEITLAGEGELAKAKARRAEIDKQIDAWKEKGRKWAEKDRQQSPESPARPPAAPPAAPVPEVAPGAVKGQEAAPKATSGDLWFHGTDDAHIAMVTEDGNLSRMQAGRGGAGFVSKDAAMAAKFPQRVGRQPSGSVVVLLPPEGALGERYRDEGSVADIVKEKEAHVSVAGEAEQWRVLGVVPREVALKGPEAVLEHLRGVAPEPVKAPEAAQGTAENGKAILQSLTRTVPKSLGGGEAPDPIAQSLLKIKDIDKVAAEIPVGSVHVPGGFEAVIFKTPDGDILRIGPVRDRPNIPEVLQPTSTKRFGENVSVERMPAVDTRGITEADVQEMSQRLDAKGYTFEDPGTDNLGRTADGNLITIDPGAVRKKSAPPEAAQVKPGEQLPPLPPAGKKPWGEAQTALPVQRATIEQAPAQLEPQGPTPGIDQPTAKPSLVDLLKKGGKSATGKPTAEPMRDLPPREEAPAEAPKLTPLEDYVVGQRSLGVPFAEIGQSDKFVELRGKKRLSGSVENIEKKARNKLEQAESFDKANRAKGLEILGERGEAPDEGLNVKKKSREQLDPVQIVQAQLDRVTDAYAKKAAEANANGEQVSPDVEAQFVRESADLNAKLQNAAFSGLPVRVPRERADVIPDAVKADNPSVEARLEGARGAPTQTIFQRLKELAGAAFRGSTRAQPHLPNDKLYAQANEGFRLLKAIPDSSSDQVNRNLAAIVDPLGPKQLALLERKLIVENQLAGLERGEPLRFGFTDKASVEAYKAKLDALITQTPEVQQALAAREAIRKETVKEAVDLGILDVQALNNQAYYHQQVTSMMDNQRYTGGARPLRITRSFQRARVTEIESLPEKFDYNTSFLEAEARWMTELKMEVAKERLIQNHFEPYDILPKLRTDAEAKGTTWRKELREYPDHEIWSPEPGNAFYRAHTIPEKIAEQLVRSQLAEAGITAQDIKESLVVGGLRRPMVIPKELASQLSEMTAPKPEGPIEKPARWLMNSWKAYTLLNPKRAIGYMARNLTGDIEPIVAAEPKALKYVPRAASELQAYYRGNLALSPELARSRDLGVFSSTMTTQEVPDIKQLDVFRRLYDTPGKAAYLAELPSRYFDSVRTFNEFRESVGRYAAYLHYKAKLDAHEPIHYGGAKKSVVDELARTMGNDVAAAHLSRNLLGDYGNLTQLGNWLRQKAMPFWSWNEINFKRWPRLSENAVRDAMESGGVESVGRLAGAAGMKAGAFLATNIVRMGSLYASVWAWNNLVRGDEERDLTPEQRASLHLNLGRNDDGSVRVFWRIGGLPDFLEWFGVTKLLENKESYQAGQVTAGDVAGEMAMDPVNKMVQAVRPDIKTGAEVALGRRAYPDVTKSRPAPRDEIIAGAIGLQDELKAVKGAAGEGDVVKPGYVDRFFGIGRVKPEQSALSEIHDLRNKYLTSRGMARDQSFGPSAIAKMRDAADVGDAKSFADAKKKYLASGGSAKGFAAALTRLDPVKGRLKDADEGRFRKFLTSDQREKLKVAQEYTKQLRFQLLRMWRAAPSKPS